MSERCRTKVHEHSTQVNRRERKNSQKKDKHVRLGRHAYVTVNKNQYDRPTPSSLRVLSILATVREQESHAYRHMERRVCQPFTKP